MENLDKLQRLDHDAIIRIEGKVDSLTINFQNMKSGTFERIVRLETRADATDIYHARVDYQHLVPLITWTEQLRANFKMMIVLGSLAVGLLGAIIERVLRTIFHI